jgi:hypothetical protein
MRYAGWYGIHGSARSALVAPISTGVPKTPSIRDFPWGKGVGLLTYVVWAYTFLLFSKPGRIALKKAFSTSFSRICQVQAFGFSTGPETFVSVATWYIGGGNSKEVDVGLLPANVTIISNLKALIGGIALWRDEPEPVGAQTEKKEGCGARRPVARSWPRSRMETAGHSW